MKCMKAAGVQQVKLSDVWRGGQGSTEVLATCIEVAEVDLQHEKHPWLKVEDVPRKRKSADTRGPSKKGKEKATEEAKAREFMIDSHYHTGESTLLVSSQRVRVVANPGTIWTCDGMFPFQPKEK